MVIFKSLLLCVWYDIDMIPIHKDDWVIRRTTGWVVLVHLGEGGASCFIWEKSASTMHKGHLEEKQLGSIPPPLMSDSEVYELQNRVTHTSIHEPRISNTNLITQIKSFALSAPHLYGIHVHCAVLISEGLPSTYQCTDWKDKTYRLPACMAMEHLIKICVSPNHYGYDMNNLNKSEIRKCTSFVSFGKERVTTL